MGNNGGHICMNYRINTSRSVQKNNCVHADDLQQRHSWCQGRLGKMVIYKLQCQQRGSRTFFAPHVGRMWWRGNWWHWSVLTLNCCFCDTADTMSRRAVVSVRLSLPFAENSMNLCRCVITHKTEALRSAFCLILQAPLCLYSDTWECAQNKNIFDKDSGDIWQFIWFFSLFFYPQLSQHTVEVDAHLFGN